MGCPRCRALKRFLLLVSVVVFALEVPTRAIYSLVSRPRPLWSVLAGAHPESFRKNLIHDFFDPATRIQYEFDMYLGWRAKPNQYGFTYQINQQGRRDSFDYPSVDGPVIFLTGGSSAWSLGASDNTHMLSALLERTLNETLHSQQPVRVLNLADQAYGMRQEFITVIDYLKYFRPRLVIFFDGLNDLHTVSFGMDPQHYRTWTFFPQILRSTLKEVTHTPFVITLHDISQASVTWRAMRAATRLIRRQWDSENQMIQEASLSPEEKTATTRFFRDQIRHSSRILHELGIPSLFVLQPLGWVDKPPNAREVFLRAPPRWWLHAYDILEEEYESLDSEPHIHTLSLSHVFHNERRQTYLDHAHMNNLGNSIVAKALADAIRAKFGIFIGESTDQ